MTSTEGSPARRTGAGGVDLFAWMDQVDDAPVAPAPVREPRWPRVAAAVLLLLPAAVVAVRIAGLAARLPATPAEAGLAAAAYARLHGADTVAAGLGPPVARLQLTVHAGLTGAFDRYDSVLGGAREQVVVAAAVLLGALVAWAWTTRTRVVSVALTCLVVTLALPVLGPVGVAVATLGPGLLGAMWLAVGAAVLAVRGGPALRLVGAVAVVAAVLTAPLLSVVVALALVVRAVRGDGEDGRTALTFAVTLLLGVAAVALTWALTPAETTGVLSVTTLYPALLALAAVALTLLLARVVDAVAGDDPRITPRLLAGAVAAVATAAAGVLTAPAPPPGPVPGLPHRELAAWARTSLPPGLALSAPPLLGADLLRDGMLPDRLRTDGALAVVDGDPAAGTAVARFGGLAVVTTDPLVAAARQPSPGSAEAGAQLAGNPGLVALPAVRAELTAGALDPRALAVLAALAGRNAVAVVELPVIDGEDPGQLHRQVRIASLSDDARRWLEAQQPPYAPVVGDDDADGSVTLTWTLATAVPER